MAGVVELVTHDAETDPLAPEAGHCEANDARHMDEQSPEHPAFGAYPTSLGVQKLLWQHWHLQELPEG